MQSGHSPSAGAQAVLSDILMPLSDILGCLIRQNTPFLSDILAFCVFWRSNLGEPVFRKSRNEQGLRFHSQALLVEAAGIEPASRDISMQASTHVVDPICTLCRRPAPRSTGLPLDQSAAVLNPGRRQHRPETIRNYSRQSGLSGEVPQPGLPC